MTSMTITITTTPTIVAPPPPPPPTGDAVVALQDPTPPGQPTGFRHVSSSVTLRATTNIAGVTLVSFFEDGVLLGTSSSLVSGAYQLSTKLTRGRRRLTASVIGTGGTGTSPEVEVLVNPRGRWAGPNTPIFSTYDPPEGSGPIGTPVIADETFESYAIGPGVPAGYTGLVGAPYAEGATYGIVAKPNSVGKAARLIVGTSTSRNARLYQKKLRTVTPGQRVRVSCFARTSDSQKGRLRFDLFPRSSSGSLAPHSSPQLQVGLSEQSLYYDWVVPTGVVSFEAAVTYGGVSGGGAGEVDPSSWLDIDDLTHSVLPPIEETPTGTWLSGQNNILITQSGAFAEWRNRDLDIIGLSAAYDTEANAIASAGWLLGSQGTFPTMPAVDYSWGGPLGGQTWSQAASGGLDEYWITGLIALKDVWGSRDPSMFYLRFAESMNIFRWFWVVKAEDVQNYVAAHRRFYGLVQQYFPGAKVVFAPAARGTQSSSYDTRSLWPGDQYVDIVGVSYFNLNPQVTSAAGWTSALEATWPTGEPIGLEKWRAFAASKGKPFAVTQWGNPGAVVFGHQGGGESTAFIEGMHSWLSEHSGSGVGLVKYEILENEAGIHRYDLYPTTVQPNTAARYQQLWGGVSATTPDAPLLRLTEWPEGNITVYWMLGSDGGSPITGLTLERADVLSNGAYGPWGAIQLITGTPAVSAFDDTTVIRGRAYAYRVMVYNLLGPSPFSDTKIAVSTGVAPPPPPVNNVQYTYYYNPDLARTAISEATSLSGVIAAWNSTIGQFYGVSLTVATSSGYYGTSYQGVDPTQDLGAVKGRAMAISTALSVYPKSLILDNTQWEELRIVGDFGGIIALASGTVMVVPVVYYGNHFSQAQMDVEDTRLLLHHELTHVFEAAHKAAGQFWAVSPASTARTNWIAQNLAPYSGRFTNPNDEPPSFASNYCGVSFGEDLADHMKGLHSSTQRLKARYPTDPNLKAKSIILVNWLSSQGMTAFDSTIL